jgi:hypothetical protein
VICLQSKDGYSVAIQIGEEPSEDYETDHTTEVVCIWHFHNNSNDLLKITKKPDCHFKSNPAFCYKLSTYQL